MNIRNIVFVSLFVTLYIIGSYMIIPIGIVPVVLTNFFIILGVLLLNLPLANLSIVLYVLLGAIGLPVFSMGRGGLAVLLGPTGGFILGYILSVFVGSVVKKLFSERFLGAFFCAFIVGFLIYLPGLYRLKNVINASWSKTLGIGLYPFILPDILKIICALIVYRMTKAYFKNYFE